MATLTESIDKFSDQIKEQEWFQQAHGAFQQLPPDQQKLVKYGSLSVACLLFLYFTWTMVSSANQNKNDYYEGQDLLQIVTQAGNEIRGLKGQNAGFSQATTQNWKQTFQGLATGQGLGTQNIEVSKESPGATLSVLQETLIDVDIKAVTLRPLVQLLFQVEHGNPPMKLRALRIESGSGEGGLLNAKLSVSGFTAKAEKK